MNDIVMVSALCRIPYNSLVSPWMVQMCRSFFELGQRHPTIDMLTLLPFPTRKQLSIHTQDYADTAKERTMKEAKKQHWVSVVLDAGSVARIHYVVALLCAPQSQMSPAFLGAWTNCST
jgi:hypothetical protein